MEMKLFRILDAHEIEGCPQHIPWFMVEPHRDQAMKNHNQTLERLQERGGLSAQELWYVLHEKKLTLVNFVSKEEAVSVINSQIRWNAERYFWDLSGEDRVKVLANMGCIPAAKTTHLPQNVEAQFIRKLAKEGRLNELIDEILKLEDKTQH